MNLKIELGDFFEDYRKETLLFVDIEEKHLVSDVIKYICEVCEIDARQEINETICLFANGTYIPEKQPSLVLKEVKDILSLKRQWIVRKISNAPDKSYSIESSEGEKKERNINNVENCIYSASAISPNHCFNVIKNSVSLEVRSKDWKRQVEVISNNGTDNSKITKVKRKKHRKKTYDNPDILLGNEKNPDISLECSNNEDVNNSLNHLELNHEVSSPFVIDHDMPMCLDDQNDTKSTAKRKKLKNKTKYEVGSAFNEGCIYDNTENIVSKNERECLLTPSIDNCSASSIYRPIYDIAQFKDSKIVALNDELIKEKLHDSDRINDPDDCNNTPESLTSFTNPLKRKRKRKHKKKNRVTPSVEFSSPTRHPKVRDNFQQKSKLLKMMDNSDNNSKHVKFDSEEEISNIISHSENITTIDTPISDLPNVIYDSGNFSNNQESPECTNSLLCSNELNVSPSLGKFHSVMPFTFQLIGKDPPSPSQIVDRSIDAANFMPLLELEESKDVSIFKRKNLKPCVDSKNIEPVDSYKQELNQISSVPHSPPSCTNFSQKLNKDINSELSHWEELEKSVYPHIYNRKKKETTSKVHNGAVTLKRNIINIHTVDEENFSGLPSSFTSSISKCQKKELPFLNSSFTANELSNDYQINTLNDSNIAGDGISFLGAKPKKLKEKKMYSLGTIIKSLRNSKQKEIATNETGIETIKDLNLNHKERDTVMVDKLDYSLKDDLKHEYCDNEQVMIGNGSDIHENFNNVAGKAAIANGVVKSETNLLDSHSNVELPLPVDTAKILGRDNFSNFYKSCPILSILPNKGDIIAAKVMTLDETYSPCFSDYRPAKVNSISGLTLSLLFLDQGEFTVDELRKDTVTSIGKDGKICKLDWRDLKDVRLVFP